MEILTSTTKISCIQPKASPKMDRIFAAMCKGFPNTSINTTPFDLAVLWGLIGNNVTRIKHGEKPFIFCDMPYHGRLDSSKNLTDRDYDRSYWRMCFGDIHNNTQHDLPNDRFKEWGIELSPYREGKYILICPSSESVTMLLHGVTVSQWIESTRKSIQQHTTKPVRVRMKPRAKGTSGPAAVSGNTKTIEQELEDTHALVTSASLTAVDALKAGVPVFATSDSCPAAWCTNRDFSLLDNPNKYDRTRLFNNLAYKQFTIEELRNGTAYDIMRTRLL